MSKLEELMKKLKTDKNEEETLKEFEEEGNNTADEIAETLGQKEEKNSFVPKVDVPPIELPEGWTIDECGIIKRDKEDETEKNESNREER